MAERAFKYFSIVAGGTPQPVFGTKIGAALVATAAALSVLVTDSSMFLAGDYAVFDVGANEERVKVLSIPDATHIQVEFLNKAHAINTYVRLGHAIAGLLIQSKDGNTGDLFVGTSPSMVIATGVFMLSRLAKVAAAGVPISYVAGLAQPSTELDACNYWIDGTTNDTYLPSCSLV